MSAPDLIERLRDHYCTDVGMSAETASDIELAADHIASLESERDALRAALEKAQNEIKRLKTPDHYWDWSDPESGYADISEAVSNADMGSVVRLLTGKNLGDVWATTRVLTVDDNGDWDDHEIACFDNEADAKRCWPESLDAARALSSSKGGK